MSKKNLPGVFPATKKDGTLYYRASITYHGKHISLGSFSSPFSAHNAYLEASHILTGEDLLTLENFEDTHHYLSFLKWVTLINYRDNGIYIKTPIYLYEKYFLYYFSLTDYYIFDIDDLFYYSSHKIMRRNGHLFVADYGMQVNIFNRYGIKNYPRIGIDYVHINDNPKDFRYENIQILNQYHGVTKVMKQGREQYKSSIHINGSIVIGYYDSNIDAAIAYNKAIDILKKRGSSKTYTENYIFEIPQKKYADIYASITLSPYFRL